jgi:hydroxypyruvate isomerase
MRFDVNCSILFTELPLLERPAAAKTAGFDAVEFWWPFPDPVPTDREADAFIGALGDAGVTLASLNFAAGDLAAGERGLLSLPDRCAEFRDNIDACVGIAEGAGCWALNAVYGNRVDGVSEQEQDELAVESLTLAAAAAARIGAKVLIEALNSYDSPGFPLVSSESAIAVIDRVPAGNVAFLADLYHLARMDEDLIAILSRHRDRIGHVQIADAPGRGAPGTGRLDFEPVFAQLAAQGYKGRVGLEYVPSDPGNSSASLGWVWSS